MDIRNNIILRILQLKRLFKSIIFNNNQISIEEFRLRGCVIGENCHIYTNKIDLTHGWLIEIGDNVTISHAEIQAHDASTKNIMGFTKVGKVKIGNNVFVGTQVVILPGVTIGDNVVIGAGAIVSRDIPSNSICAGNPAVVIDSYDHFHEKNLILMQRTMSPSLKMEGGSGVKEEILRVLEKERFSFDK